ncbi:MAG: dihydroxy-acid dehydratase [Desulfobacterales bacterium]|nr:MAG: dihydroxy-acid dehydratase [Desulfobacterales bacterium]
MGIQKKDSHLPDYARVERQQMLRGAGYGDEAIERLQIGVVSSWGEINPAAINLDRVTAAVKAGVWAAGGTPREFVISSICTSMAGNDSYHLPQRDLIAGYIETAAQTNLFDAMVFVPVCDDVIPGHLMAAARLNLPAVVVTGGYMLLNRYQGEVVDPLKVAPRHFAEFKAGKMSAAEFCRIKDRGCPGMGACPVMGTANTMAAMAEALGMSLPNNAAVPGSDSRLMRIAFNAGQQVVELHRKGIKPSDVLTLDAFKNAIRVLMAIGGSTNAVLHLQAIASELNLDIPLQTFNELSNQTPFICDIAPSGSGKYHLGHLDEAGGIQSVMKELQPLLATAVMTVTANSLEYNLQQALVGNRNVIYPLDQPLAKEGGLIFLHGNLAPRGALIKKSAVPAEMFYHRGPARIFPAEAEACNALLADEIKPGEVVVVRNVGPKGAPGMELLQRFLWILESKGLLDKVVFISDGRFSGTNKGCAIAHVAPEAAEGGPLAVVADGDMIEIDIANEKLTVDISADELQQRFDAWEPPPQKVKKGYLAVYSKMAKSADQGAALDYG